MNKIEINNILLMEIISYWPTKLVIRWECIMILTTRLDNLSQIPLIPASNALVIWTTLAKLTAGPNVVSQT